MTDLLQRHVAALTSGDAQATADLYADDADLVSFDGVASGREAIAQRYAQFFEYHGEISNVEILHRQDADDALFVLFAVESERGRFELVNVYLADGDRIARHFSNETRAVMARDEVVTDAPDAGRPSDGAPAADVEAAPVGAAAGDTDTTEGTTAER